MTDPRRRELPPQARRLLPVVLLILVGLTLWRLTGDPAPTPPPGPASFGGATMGTSYTVKFGRVLDPDERRAVARLIEETLSTITASMSTYEPNSELSRFNRDAKPGEPFAVSQPLRTVLDIAVDVGGRTDGALDITVGPAVDAWGFGAGDAGGPPPATDDLLDRMGWSHVLVDNRGITRHSDRVRCDVSAIAKGYATDVLAQALEARGHRDYLIEVGGELHGSGSRPEGGPWRVGIEKPLVGERQVMRVISLDGMAMATSGDYRNFIERDGKRRSHLFNPATGEPITHDLASVTVVHDQGAFADAWATALMVMGPHRGPSTAERERIAAFFVVRDGDGRFKTLETSAFAALPEADDAVPARGPSEGDQTP